MIYEFLYKLRYPLFLTSDIYLRIYSNIKFLSNYKINARELDTASIAVSIPPFENKPVQ